MAKARCSSRPWFSATEVAIRIVVLETDNTGKRYCQNDLLRFQERMCLGPYTVLLSGLCLVEA